MKKYDGNEVDQNLHMNECGFCWLIVTEKAKEVFNTGLFDLYEVRDNDTESLIENTEELNLLLENGAMIGIEVGHSTKQWGDMVCPTSKKPQLLDPETFTVKIISIDRATLSKQTLKVLEKNYTYKDTQIGEHLFGCQVREDILQFNSLAPLVETELKEIEIICNQQGAAYFRIVNP